MVGVGLGGYTTDNGRMLNNVFFAAGMGQRGLLKCFSLFSGDAGMH